MENNYLDKRIRDVMENLEGEFQAGHWEQMEQLLNDPANADLSENELDHNLRNKLTDTAPALAATHWEQMEQLLNDPANADLSENELDHSLRNKLTDSAPVFAAAHWNLFEQQLDTEFATPEIEDVYLDGVTYELLNDLEAPYNADHWNIMQKRLEEEFSLRYKLVKYKVAELALLALALFTVVSYLPSDKVSAFRLPIAKNTSSVEKTQTQSAETIQSKEIASANMPTNTNTEATNPAATIAPSFAPANLDNSTPTSKALSPSTSITNGNSGSLNNQTPLSTTSIDLLKSTALPIAANSLTPTEEKSQAGISDDLPLNTNEASNPDLGVADLLEEQLQLIPIIKGLEISALPEKSNSIISGISTDIWKAPSFLRIGMLGAGEVNYIMTPYNEEYDQAAVNTFESGYGGGITLGYKFGRWEIEMGAMYSNKFYNPDTINVTINAGDIGYGYEGIAWTSTQLDVLRVPVRARYDFAKKGKWHVYSQAGLAANVTLNRIHSREVVPLSTFNLEENPLRSPLRSPTDPISPALNKVNSPQISENVGLLEEGSLNDNHYFTVELGFGVERFLSPRFSFFAQPTFQYQLGQSNIGLNKERINNLSVESGIRVSLKRNK